MFVMAWNGVTPISLPGQDLHESLGAVCDVRKDAGLGHRLADEVDLIQRQVLEIQREI